MELTVHSDEFYMREALKEARKAFDMDEIPVGAVIVCEQRIIARAHNLTERLNDVTAHAEMQAFTAAANYLGAKFLDDCALYVTIEPCIMCGGASYWTRIGKVVFGARDEKRGLHTLQDPVLHRKTKVTEGVLEKECAGLMTEYFRQKRDQ